jgi:polysaccharide deacetylase 2 family uncharacterized protein YibQ
MAKARTPKAKSPKAETLKAVAGKSRMPETSALRTGVSQLAISLGLFACVGAVAAAGIEFFGDASAAAPRVQVALFQPHEGPVPYMRTRLDNSVAPEVAAAYAHGGEPTLPGVAEYGGEAASDTPTVRIGSLGAEAAPQQVSSTPLARAPILGFFERTPAGDLPRISPDGQTPAQAYARPFTPNGQPRISIVLGGLGLNAERTLAAINTLPGEVTLSFVPYAPDLQTWINRARAAGHEVLLELPMEPYDYPNVDTGPHTLLTNASTEENLRRLDLLMGKATGYFGVTNYQGAKFATDARAAAPVFGALARRGLVFLHDGGAVRSALPDAARTSNLGFRVADRILDAEPAREAIDRQLLEIEALAQRDGQALGVGYGYPVTIDQLKNWAEGLRAKGYQLAPASSSAGVRAASAAPASPLSRPAAAAPPAAAPAPAASAHH